MSNILFEEKKFGYRLAVLDNRIEWSMWGTKSIIPLGNISDIIRPVPFMNKVDLILSSGRTIAVYPKKVDEFLSIVSQFINH